MFLPQLGNIQVSHLAGYMVACLTSVQHQADVIQGFGFLDNQCIISETQLGHVLLKVLHHFDRFIKVMGT